jgi:precorrin-6B methylase 1
VLADRPAARRQKLLAHFRFGSASSGVAIVSFQRLRKPNVAIVPTISTICSSVQRLRICANISSVTSFGAAPAASARNRAPCTRPPV